jgi:uncharacterized RDD family membrane protein YckC
MVFLLMGQRLFRLAVAPPTIFSLIKPPVYTHHQWGGKMQDRITINTPESVDLTFETAGLGSRFVAAMIDGLIQGSLILVLILIGIFGAMGLTGDTFLSDDFPSEGAIWAIVLFYLVIMGILYGYFIVFETLWNGQTPGKRLMKIRVIKQNGLPAGFLSILIRNLLRLVDALPSAYAVGVISILATRRGQRLGDLTAGTIVVKEAPSQLVTLPTALWRDWVVDPNLLAQYVPRLSDSDLEPARLFWSRRGQFRQEARTRVAEQIAWSIARKMEWPFPRIPHPEMFLEDILMFLNRPASDISSAR